MAAPKAYVEGWVTLTNCVCVSIVTTFEIIQKYIMIFKANRFIKLNIKHNHIKNLCVTIFTVALFLINISIFLSMK